MGLTKMLKKQAFELTGKALEKLMADENRAMQIARAVGAVQKGKQSLNKAGDDVLHAMGLANRADYKELGKRLNALKRRVKGLAEKVEKKV